MIVRISGIVEVSQDDGNTIADDAILAKLHNAEPEDVCSNYLENDLYDLEIQGGSIRLIYSTDRTIRVVTEYLVSRRLTTEELESLVEETLGQWSDGLGEGCFDDLSDTLGITIDLCNTRQSEDLQVEQIESDKQISPYQTKLAKAAYKGDFATVQELLKEQVDLEIKHKGYTALLLAVIGGHAEIALALIAHNADIHAKDPRGADPLLICASSNSMNDIDAARVARVLLEHGVDTHARKLELDQEYTPMYMALNRNKRALVDVLKEFGATE